MSAKTKIVEILHVFAPGRDANGNMDHHMRGETPALLVEDADRLVDSGAARLVSQGGGAKADEQKAAGEVEGAGTDASAPATPEQPAADATANAGATPVQPAPVDDPKPTVEPFEGDTAALTKAQLVEELTKRNVEHDGRWTNDRLKAALDAALAG